MPRYSFGTERFGLSIYTDSAEAAYIKASYVVQGHVFGEVQWIEIYDAYSCFEEMVERMLGLRNCSRFNFSARELLEEYRSAITAPAGCEDFALIDDLNKHSLWFHHGLGECYILAFKSYKRIKIVAAPQDLEPLCEVEIESPEMLTILSKALKCLSDNWNTVSARRS